MCVHYNRTDGLTNLAGPEVDVEVDELTVFPDNLLQCVLLQEVVCLFLQMQAAQTNTLSLTIE